jgi:hypothetical protein
MSGIYALPEDHDGSLLTLIRRSQLFFKDLPEIHRRRERRAYNEVLSPKTRASDLGTISRISTSSPSAG